MKEVVVLSAVRTPIGGLGGYLASLTAPELGAVAIREALARASVTPDQVNSVFMGNVISAGVGQAPARQAALRAQISKTAACTTINKVCGSGLAAVMFAAQTILLGEADVIVAGGMESMTNAPYLLDRARGGYRLGHGSLIDSLIKDGLWDALGDFHMGAAVEKCAERFGISRAEQDEFAATSYARAAASAAARDEVVPVALPKTGSTPIANDEAVKRFDAAKMRALKPAFKAGGTVTAGNSSSISDGAAALVLTSGEKAAALGLKPLARIAGFVSTAREPEWFMIAPADAIPLLMKKTGCELADVDLFEINEAFAASSIAVNRLLELDPAKVNVRGGAVALGHPLGASGARIVTTLLHAMIERGARRGVAALCIGGGEALATMVERI